MEPPEGTPATDSVKRTDPKRTAIIVLAIVVVAAFAWALGSKYLAVAAAQRDGVMQSAAAVSTSLVPLLEMNSKGQLPDAGALQRIVDDVVGSKRFSYAAILDSSGRVIVASNRNTSPSSQYPDFKANEVVERSQGGAYEVIYPVKQGTTAYGAVALRAPTDR